MINQGFSSVYYRVLINMWITTWPKSATTNPSQVFLLKDPTEACLALMTLNKNGSFKEANDVTRPVSMLENCMRLTFPKEIGAHVDEDSIQEEQTACDGLEPWFTEKKLFTFAHLRSLQHRASAIAYDTMEQIRICWTDRET